MLNYLCVLLLICSGMKSDTIFPIKKIIGKGLLKSQYWQYLSDPANSSSGEQYHFYCNVSPKDSLTVIAENTFEENKEYAFIVHNGDSDSHSMFTEENLRTHREKQLDDYAKTQLETFKKRSDVQIDEALLQELGPFWVYVYKYQGEYYLHQDWACAVNVIELGKGFLIRINMETIPKLMLEFSGDVEHFKICFERGEEHFTRIDKEREIYRRNDGAYLIPARRVRDFKLIAYCANSGDLINPFVEFDKK